MNVGGPELLIIVVVWAVFIVPPVWALVDAGGRPVEQFEAIGQSRTTWIGVLIVGMLCCPLMGLVAGIYYLVNVRSRLAAA